MKVQNVFSKIGTAMVAILCIVMLSGCCKRDRPDDEVETVAVTDVALNRNEMTLVKGDIAILEVTVTPDNATDKTVEWGSDKPLVALVDGKGVVLAVGAGTATVTAAARVGGKKAVCVVTVTNE